MLKGTYEAKLTVNINVDDSDGRVKPYNELAKMIENGEMDECIREAVAEVMGEEEGMATVSVERLHVDFKKI